MQTTDTRSPARNNSIDMFRYIAAILVVSVHTDPLIEFQPMLSYLVVQVLPRVAVPCFFAVAGYYCTVKLNSGTFDLWGYVRRLLVPYALWTLVYFAYNLLMYGIPDIPKWVVSFFVFGSVYHFWFFPALILAVCLLTVLHHFEKCIVPMGITLALVGCLGHGYYQLGQYIPLLSSLYAADNWIWICHVFFLGIPSCFLGYYIRRKQPYWSTSEHVSAALATSFVLSLVEVFVLKILEIPRAITETITLFLFVYYLIVWLLRHPMPEMGHLAKICRSLSNVTYYSHVLFIMVFLELNSAFFGGHLTPTVKFLFAFGATLVIGLLLCRSGSKTAKALIT